MRSKYSTPPAIVCDTAIVPRNGSIDHQLKEPGGFAPMIEYVSESTVLSVVALTVVTMVPADVLSSTDAV